MTNILLDFETDLETVEAEIAELRRSDDVSADGIIKRLASLQKERDKQLRQIYKQLSDWQICQVARHPNRPQTHDYIRVLITDFVEMAGDRLYSEDRAIIAGIGHFGGTAVAVCGHQKGSDTNDRLQNNFGMPHPEGYRKVLRIMDLADKFGLPLISFVDTPGAYPGIGAEERGQSSAIGECLRRSAGLRIPFITFIIGEGGSGGALAMASGDHTAMLQYSIYSVISPEGCASILWKDSSRMKDAAENLSLTAAKLKKLALIDEIVNEPPGGAHRSPESVMESVRTSLQQALTRLSSFDEEKLVENRYQRWRHYGRFKEA